MRNISNVEMKSARDRRTYEEVGAGEMMCKVWSGEEGDIGVYKTGYSEWDVMADMRGF